LPDSFPQDSLLLRGQAALHALARAAADTRASRRNTAPLTPLTSLQGATLLYTTYVDPFLSQHEEAIDAALSEAKSKAKAAGLAWVARMWERVKGSVLNAALVSGRAPLAGETTSHFSVPQAQEAPQNYTMSNPGAAAPQPAAQGAAAPFMSLFQTYAPAAIAFGSNALSKARAGAVEPPPQAASAAASRRAPKLKTQSSASSASLGRSAAATRRRELERQLAELDAAASSSDDGAANDSLQVPASLRPGGSSSRRTSSPAGYSSSPAPSSDEDRRAARSAHLGGSYEMLDRLSVDTAAANRSRPGSSGSGASQKPAWFWGGGSPTKKKSQ
jgi:hypothetical protein